MARPGRPRKEFKFQLYQDQSSDNELMTYVIYLNKTRQFGQVIRNGLRLVWSLGQGDLSVLFELFPALQTQFIPRPEDLVEEFRQLLQVRVAPPPPPEVPVGPQQLELPMLDLVPTREIPPPPVLHNDGMERAIQEAVQAGIQQVLSQLAPVLSQPPSPPVEHPNGNGSLIKGPQPLAGAKPLAVPVFDDADTVVIRRDTTSGEAATNNFHASMMALMTSQSTDDDDAPPVTTRNGRRKALNNPGTTTLQ